MKYLLILLFFFSCTKEQIEPVGDIADQNRSQSTLVYYANQHFTNMNWPTTPMNVWSATVTFHRSCEYYCQDEENQIDYNKLFGIRKSPLALHRNGAYIGWNYVPAKDSIRLAWYLHDDDGGFESLPIPQTIYVALEDPITLYIANYNAYFIYVLDNHFLHINKSAHNIDNFSNGWRLNPWSGGQETQDHNMIVSINN